MTARTQRGDTSARPVRWDAGTLLRGALLRGALLRGALLHGAFRLAGWLLLAVAALATWPLAVVTGAGYAVAWRRDWPAARLGRQAGWTLPMTAVWIAAESARGWRAVGLDPVRDGDSGWPHLTVMTVARTFLLVAPVTIPAGLALAALLWARWTYSATFVEVARTQVARTQVARTQVARAQVARPPAARAPVVLPAPRRASGPAPDPVQWASEIPGVLETTPSLDDILGPGVRR
jgi:hypothetical protein